MTHWVLDIETTLDHNTIRLVGIHNDRWSWLAETPAELDAMLAMVEKGDTIWTWNGEVFDLPVLKRLWGIDLKARAAFMNVSCHDAMIFAKMLFPDEYGGHSLDNFSKKYNPTYVAWKPDDLEWYNDAPLEDIGNYLLKDLKETYNVVNNLIAYSDEIGGEWDHALKVEERVRDITNEQVEHKVRFDLDSARILHHNLDLHAERIEDQLEPWLPTLPVVNPKPPPKKQFKADGTLSAHMERYCDDFDLTVVYKGDDIVITDHKGWLMHMPLKIPYPAKEKLTLKNQARVKQWLMDHGWKPTWWNHKTDPVTRKKVNTSPRLSHQISKDPCPDLKRFGNQGELITEWLMVTSRRSLLANKSFTTGLIPRAEANNGYLASDADTTGTNTARWRHKGIVNIPRASSDYGKEFRELFCARKNTKWVGWDASSLEACIEAHYTYKYDKAYARTLVQGDSSKGTDVHSRNMDLLGLPNRDIAKTFKYAITYGAQPATLAGQLSISKSDAQTLFDEFWDTNHGLRHLRDDLLREWKYFGGKYIVGLDGRLIATRSEHSLINAKFQSGGAIVMKHAMLIANKTIKEYAKQQGIKAYGLIRYHDEEQWESNGGNYDLNVIGKLGVESITKAGEFLKLNVPLSGEYQIGNNWAETH